MVTQQANPQAGPQCRVCLESILTKSDLLPFTIMENYILTSSDIRIAALNDLPGN